jgi:hypothetical protein
VEINRETLEDNLGGSYFGWGAAVPADAPDDAPVDAILLTFFLFFRELTEREGAVTARIGLYSIIRLKMLTV